MTQDAYDFARDLRALADWYEAHPDYPAPSHPQITAFANGAEEMRRVARAGGRAEKIAMGTFFVLRRVFGRVRIDVATERENVCRAVVTGTREIPATEASIVDEVEWICTDPLLAPEEPS